MSRFATAGRAAFVLAACLAARAEADSFASSASSAGSASSGSSSDSVHGSSGSSQGGRHGENVDYRIVSIDDAVDHPGHARLTLQADDPALNLSLDVPRAVAEKEAFGPGDVVSARKRVYGWAFARGGAHDPFFLVFDDEWQARFVPRRVS